MQWIPGLVLPVIVAEAFEDEDGVGNDVDEGLAAGGGFNAENVDQAGVNDLGEVVNALAVEEGPIAAGVVFNAEEELAEIEIVAVAPLNQHAPLMPLQNALVAPAVNEDAPHGFEDGAAGQNAVVVAPAMNENAPPVQNNAEDGGEILRRPLKRRRRSI
ncbi:PREDICTED: uncharacterized protein LOC104736962 [Camelina sativa]|uniref:Uncharacterized protein LOC104736962 n=1 Tax=Camelina sativa TaxID=90675 RepID=A0ABM0VFE8_CAMSA|nr:PREDICTED: uncharacterized protein LOC104736962 [Camelina sativa]